MKRQILLLVLAAAGLMLQCQSGKSDAASSSSASSSTSSSTPARQVTGLEAIHAAFRSAATFDDFVTEVNKLQPGDELVTLAQSQGPLGSSITAYFDRNKDHAPSVESAQDVMLFDIAVRRSPTDSTRYDSEIRGFGQYADHKAVESWADSTVGELVKSMVPAAGTLPEPGALRAAAPRGTATATAAPRQTGNSSLSSMTRSGSQSGVATPSGGLQATDGGN